MKEKSLLRQKDIRTGAQQERERIIALLEAEMIFDRPVVIDRSDLVALIRGGTD